MCRWREWAIPAGYGGDTHPCRGCLIPERCPRLRSGGSTHSQSSQYSQGGGAGGQYGQQRDMRGSWDKKSSTGSVGSARDSRDSRGSRGSHDGLRMSSGPGQPLLWQFPTHACQSGSHHCL